MKNLKIEKLKKLYLAKLKNESNRLLDIYAANKTEENLDNWSKVNEEICTLYHS